MIIRSLSCFAAIVLLVAGLANAQPGVNQPMSPWPAGAGANRDSVATVSARAVGHAAGKSVFRGRISVQRRGATREEAGAALEKALDEIRALGGVELRNVRREAGRINYENPQMAQFTPGQPLPAIPPRGQMVPYYLEIATVEVEAPSRKNISDWGARVPPMPATPGQQQPFTPAPSITERLAEDDPAWVQATRNGLAAAERDARNAAEAAGGELGRLEGMWTERLGYVTDGNAQVQVTAEYQIAKPRR